MEREAQNLRYSEHVMRCVVAALAGLSPETNPAPATYTETGGFVEGRRFTLELPEKVTHQHLRALRRFLFVGNVAGRVVECFVFKPSPTGLRASMKGGAAELTLGRDCALLAGALSVCACMVSFLLC